MESLKGLDMTVRETFAFMEKVYHSKGGCWIWKAAKDKDKYGLHSFRGNKNSRAHRVSYTLYIGEIPRGKQVLHRCDNPSCVKPEHLFLGTPKDNMLDKVSKGRAKGAEGVDHWSSKLNPSKVSEIVYLVRQGWPHKTVSEVYEVSASTINRIMCGYVWSKVTGL